MEFAAFAPPRPDRAFEIGRVDDHTEETVLLYGIVSRSHLESHLVICTKVDGLYVAAGAQVPEVQPMPVFVGQQILWHNAVFELRRQPPFA